MTEPTTLFLDQLQHALALALGEDLYDALDPNTPATRYQNATFSSEGRRWAMTIQSDERLYDLAVAVGYALQNLTPAMAPDAALAQVSQAFQQELGAVYVIQDQGRSFTRGDTEPLWHAIKVLQALSRTEAQPLHETLIQGLASAARQQPGAWAAVADLAANQGHLPLLTEAAGHLGSAALKLAHLALLRQGQLKAASAVSARSPRPRA